jgi:UDP-glucose 4-epimerase
MAGSGKAAPRVLIVGWGFLGASIGSTLLAEGVNVTGLTRSRTWRTEAGNADGARMVVADARAPGVIEDAMPDVDHVVFAAGGLTPPSAEANPLEAATGMLLPLLAVLEALRDRPHVSLTYISSGGAVYGDPVRLPVSESDATRPISPYGASHLAAEGYAQMYARRSGATLHVVRCANVYGPQQAHDKDQGAVAIFLDRISRELPIRIFGDGSALRDYVFVADVANTVSRIVLDRLDVGVVNLGSGRGLTVLEIVRAISDAAGRPAHIDWAPGRDFDVRGVILDVARLRSFMHYEPTDFTRGLALTADAYSQTLRGRATAQSEILTS